MAWIKRNLYFVISIAVGLLLTGYCGYLLYTTLAANSGASDDFNQTRSSLEQIEQATPFPSKENIQVAKDDQQNVRQFLAEFRKTFAPFPTPPAEDDKGFRTYLDGCLVRFRAGATNAGVGLLPDYGFAFSSLKGRLNYPPGAIAAWMRQLQEISAILDILYDAKINFLASFCRVPVSPDDAGSGDCLLQATTVTNVWGVVTPYKIVFRGFSAELAAVMDGFARSSNCFIIKAIDVTPDPSAPAIESQPPPQPEAPAMIPQQRMAAPQPMRGPRGEMIPGFRQPPPAAAPTANTTPLGVMPSAPVIILTEEPLLVTLSVDVVKLKAAEQK